MTVLIRAEVKDYLEIRGSSDDDALAAFIAAAETRVGKIVGPLEPATQTARVVSSGSGFVLPITPVVSLTSVTPAPVTGGSAAVDLAGLDLDHETGIVRALGGGLTYDAYVVVYEAGWTEVPADILLATKELVRHLWEATGRKGNGDGEGGPAGGAHALPYRVTEMLSPYEPAGFA